ncbi:MAG TPA: hypothetical protein VM370_05380 [Candidatus Thermoplasmatota archaeon]|nr:hypothetical protein [Candidatus Thermoplasmatota archaeon]
MLPRVVWALVGALLLPSLAGASYDFTQDWTDCRGEWISPLGIKTTFCRLVASSSIWSEEGCGDVCEIHGHAHAALLGVQLPKDVSIASPFSGCTDSDLNGAPDCRLANVATLVIESECREIVFSFFGAVRPPLESSPSIDGLHLEHVYWVCTTDGEPEITYQGSRLL